MKESYTILHLYPDTMDLYGDYFNVTCLAAHLAEMGLTCSIVTADLDEPFDLETADLVYIGHGKGRNLQAIAPHFVKNGAAVKEAVEGGKLFLVTGNSRMLFGRSFEGWDGQTAEGIGLFDYTGRESKQVFTADVVSRCVFDRQLMTYGFVNRTGWLVGENPSPLFEVVSGPGDGEQPDGKEGTLYKNFFATWQMGPLLTRNPGFLKELLRRMTGVEPQIDDAMEQKALALTLSEFKLQK